MIWPMNDSIAHGPFRLQYVEHPPTETENVFWCVEIFFDLLLIGNYHPFFCMCRHFEVAVLVLGIAPSNDALWVLHEGDGALPRTEYRERAVADSRCIWRFSAVECEFPNDCR